jgi:pectinesterase
LQKFRCRARGRCDICDRGTLITAVARKRVTDDNWRVRILTAVTFIAIAGAMPIGPSADGAREQIVSTHPPDAIVDASGSGTFRTVQAAIDAVPQSTSPDRRWVILVKPGVYRERIYVQREKRFVSLVGQDPITTTITFDLKASDLGPDRLPIGTYRTPTVTIDADDFAIENLTIANDAGPGSQALALRVDGDRLVVRNSRLLGWQDTLFLDRGRQSFEDTLIAGHVDFIFGGATAFFERCWLHAWRDGYLTAASTPPEQRYGFVFADGRITGESGVRTFLGRPWRGFAHVTWLRTDMTDVVRPEGWHNWDHPEREHTVRYEEFGSRGAGGSSAARVPWARHLSARQTSALTAARVLGGADHWDPQRVPSYVSVSPTRVLDAALPAAPGLEHVAR